MPREFRGMKEERKRRLVKHEVELSEKGIRVGSKVKLIPICEIYR
jgi:hypothetical protein